MSPSAGEADPHNIEAEKALLGAILADNEAYHTLPTVLPAHFYEPFHGRCWSAIERLLRRNMRADPVVLQSSLGSDPAWPEFGGLNYFASLLGAAPHASAARDYAEVVRDAALRRDLARVAAEMIKRAKEDLETTANDQVVQAEASLYLVAQTGEAASGGFMTFADVMRSTVEIVEAAHAHEGGLVGITTGLADLDAKIGGLHDTDLLVLAGRPSMGKTALATNVLFNACRAGAVVGLCSIEMSAEQLGQRILADAAGIDSERLRTGSLSDAELHHLRDVSEQLADLPFHTDPTGGLTLDQLIARSRRLKRQHGLDLLAIDYIQLVTVLGRKNSNRVEEVSMITRALKGLAKELHIPVIALSQLSRQVEAREDKRPQLSDLRESGAIEQDADVVMFVYREAYYLGRAEPREGSAEHMEWLAKMDEVRDLAEIIIGKQRHGPISTVKVAFSGATTKFSNRAGRREEDQAAHAPGSPRSPRYSFGGHQ